MKKRVLAAVLLTVLNVTPSFASHPLEGDDTATHGLGNYQLEINSEAGFDKQKQDGIETRTSSQQVATVLTAGLGERVDLAIGLPWQWLRVKQDGALTTSENGVGDLSLELKWRFLERNGFSLAVKPGMTLPTGDEDRGLGNGRVSGGVTMIATKEMAPLTMHLNARYFRNEYGLESDRQANRSDIYSASLSALFEVVKDLQLVAETGVQTNSDRTSRTCPAFATVGAIYSLKENTDLDLGVKYGLNEPATDLTLLAGFTTHF
jgi:hypothetical protein